MHYQSSGRSSCDVTGRHSGEARSNISPNALNQRRYLRCIENCSDACNIRTAARSGGATVPPPRGSFALLCLLGSASSALAQGPDDFLRTFGTITQPATVQATQAAWAKLPSKEVGCISDALHQQGGSVEALIQRACCHPTPGSLTSDQTVRNNQNDRSPSQPAVRGRCMR